MLLRSTVGSLTVAEKKLFSFFCHILTSEFSFAIWDQDCKNNTTISLFNNFRLSALMPPKGSGSL